MLEMMVPYLTAKQLDQGTAELLRDYGRWRGEPVQPPIDVDEIAEGYLGLTLEVGDLKVVLGLDDVLGATWFDERRVRIDQSLEDNEGRFAFTVAHEIGHWQLHRPLYEMDKVTLRMFPADAGSKPAAAIVCRAIERKAPAEWQADQFAARLLMPAEAVRAAVEEIAGSTLPVWEGLDASRRAGRLDARLRAFADEVLEAGTFVNVSNEAMCYRLFDLKLVRDQANLQATLL